MFKEILEHMAQPRYFWGTLYLAFLGSMGGNIIWESITCGIFFGMIDLWKESRMS
tara:strand:- start:199 stop:363 length:165 start_codon:yes stop_codon:yes gene_type:complete